MVNKDNHFSIRILVVEDDPDILNGTVHLLETAGYTVTKASTGEESLQAIKEQHPDLLLLDRDLPGIDGIEVCSRIKKNPALINIFVVIISGVYIATDEQSEGFELGADGYITRPISNRELLARVESYARIVHLAKSLAKQRTKDLLESEERLNLALESGKMGMWEWDVKKKLSIWNEKQFELLGMIATKDWISPDLFLGHVHPSDKERVYCKLQVLLENGTEYKDEFRIIRENKQVCWLAAVGQIYRDNDGKPYKLIGINYDISDRKIMAEELEQRARELTYAYKELESFSYSLSHDLRAPLLTMKGFIDILMKDCSSKFDTEMKSYFQQIMKCTMQMTDLIDVMLSLAKISNQEIKRERIDLSLIAESVVKELRSAEPERDIKVIIAEKLFVYGDARLMKIALSNLIGNAWKYSNKTPVAKIEFGVMEKESETVYYVRDNGAGFNMKYANKLFIPFQRLHSESQFRGTGIGLTIAKKVVQRHQGRIWGESEIGKGATFYFTLQHNNNEAEMDKCT